MSVRPYTVLYTVHSPQPVLCVLNINTKYYDVIVHVHQNRSLANNYLRALSGACGHVVLWWCIYYVHEELPY